MKYILFLFVFLSNTVIAIDNPDAPDYVAEFEKRMSLLENDIFNNSDNTLAMSMGYIDLEDALDKELNLAYKMLISHLTAESKQNLINSQKQWIKYRDTEFEFISENFTREAFGSSSNLSIGTYRTSIIRSRVKELLWYLKNYSPN